MPTERTRDVVWKIALNKAYREGEGVFPAELAQREGVSEKTVRETLGVMVKNGFLKKGVGTEGRVRYDPHPSFCSQNS